MERAELCLHTLDNSTSNLSILSDITGANQGT